MANARTRWLKAAAGHEATAATLDTEATTSTTKDSRDYATRMAACARRCAGNARREADKEA